MQYHRSADPIKCACGLNTPVELVERRFAQAAKAALPSGMRCGRRRRERILLLFVVHLFVASPQTLAQEVGPNNLSGTGFLRTDCELRASSANMCLKHLLLTVLRCQNPALKLSCCVNHLLMYVQGSSQGSSASSSCNRPVIDEDRLQEHACTLFTKVCIDQVRIDCILCSC